MPRRPPAGFLALGDALCGFNPVYRQGATVAALEAEALTRRWPPSRRRDAARGRRRAPFRVAAGVVARPWALAVDEDLRFPEVVGPRPPGARPLRWYADRLHEAARTQAEVCRAFLEVMDLRRAAASVFRPGVAARALRHRLTGGAGRAAPEPGR